MVFGGPTGTLTKFWLNQPSLSWSSICKDNDSVWHLADFQHEINKCNHWWNYFNIFKCFVVLKPSKIAKRLWKIGLLPLAEELNFLENLAAALDCPHQTGVCKVQSLLLQGSISFVTAQLPLRPFFVLWIPVAEVFSEQSILLKGPW